MAGESADSEQTTASNAAETAHEGAGLSAWLDQVGAFAYRTTRDVSRSWTVLGVAVGLPPVMYLLLTATREFPPTQKGLFAVGIAVLGATIASLTVFGSQLAVDADDRRFHAYRSMAVSPSADVVGRMLAGVGVAAVSLLVGLLVGVATGAPIGVAGVVPAVTAFGGFVGVSVVFASLAVPVVVAANDEQYAQFALSLIAVFAFMLTGYNGIVPSVAVLDEAVVRLLPNTLGTRAMALQLVTTDGVEITQTDGWPALLAGYALAATGVAVALVRRGLYDRGVLP
ncbi:ABC transporter permease [Halobaculum sp. MBLA0143]|uniref:ABC transporter permease n=1 Tax=Halobaculum sp. MBLA0143 TaxID=3079933 RepID=UPI003523B174